MKKFGEFSRTQIFRFARLSRYLQRKPSSPSPHHIILPFHHHNMRYYKRQRNPPGLILVWDRSHAFIKFDDLSTFIPSSGRVVNNVYPVPTRLFQETDHPETLLQRHIFSARCSLILIQISVACRRLCRSCCQKMIMSD